MSSKSKKWPHAKITSSTVGGNLTERRHPLEAFNRAPLDFFVSDMNEV